MSTILNTRGVGFLEVAENFFFFFFGSGPPLETATETWKNAANVGAAQLLKTIHAGVDICDLEKAIRESQKVILTSTAVTVASGGPANLCFVPTREP